MQLLNPRLDRTRAAAGLNALFLMEFVAALRLSMMLDRLIGSRY
jgi:hypothetical protein